MENCIEKVCQSELRPIRSDKYNGWGYLGFFHVDTYECPWCHKQYQARTILDEEASTENRVLYGVIEPRLFTDEELDSAENSADLDIMYEKRIGRFPEIPKKR